MSTDGEGTATRSVGPFEDDHLAALSKAGENGSTETGAGRRQINRASLWFFVVFLAVVLAAGHVLAHLAAALLDKVSGVPGGSVGLALLFGLVTLALFVAFAVGVHSLRFTPHPPESAGKAGSPGMTTWIKRWAHPLESFMAVLALLFGHAFAIVVHHALHGQHLLTAWAYGVAAVLVVVGVIVLHRLRRDLTVHHTLSKPVGTEEYVKTHEVEALILHVSTNDFTLKFDQGEGRSEVWLRHERASSPAILLGEDLREDVLRSTPGGESCAWSVEEPVPRWNWQQLLRAIAPYCDRGGRRPLRWVWLLTSRDKEDQTGRVIRGSDEQGEDCARLLAKYFTSDTRFKPVRELDFEDFDELSATLDEILHHLREERISPERTVIDVTGGQKVASAVGVVATLNDHYRFQYMQTEGDYAPIIYDARTVPPPAEP